MYKKLVIVLGVLAIVAGAVYFHYYYPNSQWQLHSTFRKVSAMPIDYYFNSVEKSCGIWYESTNGSGKIIGTSNESVKKCFDEAFKKCDKKSILLVKDQSILESKEVIYSLVRVILKNDNNDCLIQNSYETQFLQEDKKPIAYINTCTTLSPDLLNSCEPGYFNDLRKQ
jgi:hypothetical protein